MQPDVVDLKSFYASRLGAQVQRLLLRKVLPRWENRAGLAVLGLGYAVPYLEALREGTERTLAFMPARQGVIGWPAGELSRTALVEPGELPLRDSVIDRALLVHALEASDDPAAMLGEIWRVLGPNGRALLVVPNRLSVWAQRENTPFGYGKPYSRRQLLEVLRNALFTPIFWDEALFSPPIDRAGWIALAPWLERLGPSYIWPFAGAHVIEVEKQIYRPALSGKQSRVGALLRPVWVPSA